jgi:ABC-type glycerol-3-phosphate transport system substrate-binding protein
MTLARIPGAATALVLCSAAAHAQNGTTRGGKFDIMTIGLCETPIRGANGRLVPLDTLSAGSGVADIPPAMTGGLSHGGTLHAAPFCGKSSMIMHRTDPMEKAGLTMPDAPTRQVVREAAAVITRRPMRPARAGSTRRGTPGSTAGPGPTRLASSSA